MKFVEYIRGRMLRLQVKAVTVLGKGSQHDTKPMDVYYLGCSEQVVESMRRTLNESHNLLLRANLALYRELVATNINMVVCFEVKAARDYYADGVVIFVYRAGFTDNHIYIAALLVQLAQTMKCLADGLARDPSKREGVLMRQSFLRAIPEAQGMMTWFNNPKAGLATNHHP